MKISLFTPTHNPKYLNRLYQSILEQTYEDWEWIIVPNNTELELYNLDPRVKIHPCENSNGFIGMLKKFACEKASGDILFEMDHDDELFPTALEACAKAFQDPNVDFAYSNTCDVKNDYTPQTFAESSGWRHRNVTFNNKSIIEMRFFPPKPTSISKIWFSPNHFRAWRSSFYHKIGGHDPKLDVLDDHDLLCRTYINGNMHHIDEALYVYHVHGENTCYSLEKNAKIQTMTLEIHDKYIYPMVEKWCDREKLLKIDLCGGHGKPEGYTSVDLFNGDIIADLNGPLPFADGSVGVFRAHDALEHVKDPIHLMKEIYRCLCVDGWLLSLTPSTDGRGAFQDPTHVSFWNSNSFFYYCKAETAKYIGTPVKFQLNRVKNFYPNDYCKLHNILYVKADLVKFNDETPGYKEI